MSLTEFQRHVCRLLAESRIRSGESYVAGGAALNEILHTASLSEVLDLFHDTAEALAASWDSDRHLLTERGYRLAILHERPGYVEAMVEKGGGRVLIQWTCDSAYRFFPLMEHPDFGLTLHPFDLATNKILALAGRLEARDWIDAIHSCEAIQPLGLLAWASSGKDPGLSPAMILAEARRARYSAVEIGELAFDGPRPDPADLSRRWAAMVREAESLIEVLPAETLGTCVIERNGGLFRGGPAEARDALTAGRLLFHPGTIRGAFPRLVR